MALFAGLGNAATVAQLVGVDAIGLISMIVQAAATAHDNKEKCERLAGRVYMIAGLLPLLQDPEAMGPLAELGEALADAHELVKSCQGKGRARRFATAYKQAKSFNKVNRRIDAFLNLFPMISHIGIARRLDGVQPRARPASQEGADTFTLAELTVATNNFALLLGQGRSGKVYKGKLHDGREVAVKRLKDGLLRRAEDTFGTELAILGHGHEHVVRLLGSCAEGEERVLVYEHMDHGTLRDSLNYDASPVAASWITRVQVLLGAARAIKHLHCHAVIHGTVTSSNILLDQTWTPRVSGFGASVCRAPGLYAADPEPECHLEPAIDVYSFGVVMLEVLTGKQPAVAIRDETKTLVSWAVPSIQAGKLGDVLDRRPASEPTPRQRQALQLVADAAASCLRMYGDNRLPISDVVANLEEALQLICNDNNLLFH